MVHTQIIIAVVSTAVLTCLVLSLRNANGNVQLQVDAVHGCHVGLYERKLLSLEARKRRQRHLTHRSAAGKKRKGRPDVFGSIYKTVLCN